MIGYTYRATHFQTVREYRSAKNLKHKIFVGPDGIHHHATSRATCRLAIMLARLGEPKPTHLRARSAQDDGSFTLIDRTSGDSSTITNIDDLKKVLHPCPTA